MASRVAAGARRRRRRAAGRSTASRASAPATVPRRRSRAGVPVTLAVNKIDRLSRAGGSGLPHAAAWRSDAEIFPISARTGAGVPALVEHLAARARGPVPVRAAEHSTRRSRAARGADPRGGGSAHLPGAAARRRGRRRGRSSSRATAHARRALIWVETESQKGIVIGGGGRMIKAIGAPARASSSASSVGCTSTCRSACAPHWRTDDGLLDRLGIT